MTKRLGEEGRMCLRIPGKVVEVFREHDLIMGKVDFGGVCKRVRLEAVPGIEVGDYALVHVGFAIARINELEARRVFALLEAMNELDELEHGEAHEVARRIPRLGGGREVAAGDPGRDDPALDADGNLRRPEEVFEVTERKWRGIGPIPESGYLLRPEYAAFDAESRFAVDGLQVRESTTGIGGQALQRVKKPQERPAFGNQCTPEHPLGATIVPSEGACAAYHHYGRLRLVELGRGVRTDA
jgi:hydrogenase assembly chaperone HypC/HupF